MRGPPPHPPLHSRLVSLSLSLLSHTPAARAPAWRRAAGVAGAHASGWWSWRDQRRREGALLQNRENAGRESAARRPPLPLHATNLLCPRLSCPPPAPRSRHLKAKITKPKKLSLCLGPSTPFPPPHRLRPVGGLGFRQDGRDRLVGGRLDRAATWAGTAAARAAPAAADAVSAAMAAAAPPPRPARWPAPGRPGRPPTPASAARATARRAADAARGAWAAAMEAARDGGRAARGRRRWGPAGGRPARPPPADAAAAARPAATNTPAAPRRRGRARGRHSRGRRVGAHHAGPPSPPGRAWG